MNAGSDATGGATRDCASGAFHSQFHSCVIPAAHSTPPSRCSRNSRTTIPTGRRGASGGQWRFIAPSHTQEWEPYHTHAGHSKAATRCVRQRRSQAEPAVTTTRGPTSAARPAASLSGPVEARRPGARRRSRDTGSCM